MYTLYMHISDLSNITPGVSTLISYIPIPPYDILNFMCKITNEIEDAYERTVSSETEKSYITISKKKSRVYTYLDFQPSRSESKAIIGEIIGVLDLELPIHNWDIMFQIIDEVRDFFQENLC